MFKKHAIVKPYWLYKLYYNIATGVAKHERVSDKHVDKYNYTKSQNVNKYILLFIFI